MPGKVRILCVGNDADLLRTRCAVLERSGYDARPSLYPDALDLLRKEQFDLAIVSFFLDEQAKVYIRELVGGRTPIITLEGLTLAPELLSLIGQHLAGPV